MNDRIATARTTGNIYVAPNGTAFNMNRIGEIRNGVTISTPELSDREIADAGLTGMVNPAPPDANRLYGAT